MWKIDIVIGGDYGQGKFHNISKFIMRDKEEYDKDSNMYKNGYIYIVHKIHMKYFQK